MADLNIKKVTIYRNELPPVDANTLTYNLRYRITSENRNRVSAWSNIVSVPAPPISLINFTVSTDTAGKIVQAVWEAPASLGLSSFDLFVLWVGAGSETDYSWSYYGRVNASSQSLVYPVTVFNNTLQTTEAPVSVRLQLQRPTYVPVKEDYPTTTNLTLFHSNLLTL